MSATIKYKGNTIASITTDSSKTLKTSGKYCEGDIVVENVQDGGITPSGNKAITPSETAQSGIDVANFKTVSVGAISSTYVGSGVTKKAAATVAPSTSEQTVCASGVYTTGEQKVSAITPSIVGNLDASSFAASIVAAVEGKGVTVPDGTLLDGVAALIESIEAGGGTISGKKFISGEITFSETPTSEITISHDSLGVRSQPFVFLAASASAPSDNTGALISARSGSGVYVNSSNRFSLLSSVSDTIDYSSSVNNTSFTIKSKSATKMLAGKTYIWFRIEL